MANLLIVAHAPLASSLLSVASHVYADASARLQAIDVAPDAAPEAVEAALRAAIAERAPGEVLILTDVANATPCNVAARVADGLRVRLLAGVNVPMLWRALCYADQPLDALVARALAGGTQGVLPVGATPPQHQKPPTNDQVPDHHQQ